MAYDNIAELPTQVRLSLDDDDQQKWMSAYNEALKDGSDVADAREQAWFACKDLPSSFSYEIV